MTFARIRRGMFRPGFRSAHRAPRPQAHQHASEECVAQAAGCAGPRRHLREQPKVDGGEAVIQRRPEDPGQPEQSERGGEQRESVCKQVLRVADRVMPCVHYRPSRFSSWRSSSRAVASTTNVTRNSTNPSAINEERYIGESASANSLAMVAAMELPGISSDVESSCALPSTNVTAMVSPSARPRPRNIPPTTAE